MLSLKMGRKRTKPPIKRAAEPHIPDGKTVTPKEEVFAHELVKNMGKGMKMSKASKDAAAVAYKDNENTRQRYVYKVMGRSRVQKYVTQLLTDAGLGHHAGVRKLNMAITKGLSSDKASVADALKGLDMLFKLHNMYPAQKTETKSVRVNADLMGKRNSSLARQLRDLEEEESIFGGIEEGEIVEE